MTVAELIAKLQELPQDARMMVPCDDTFAPAERVRYGDGYVFIE